MDKPVSTAQQIILNRKLDKTSDPYVQSLNSLTGNVVINKSTIGLSNVDNTSDLNKPISNAVATALSNKTDMSAFTSFTDSTTSILNSKIDTSKLAAVNGVATLGSDGKLTSSQLPILNNLNVTSSATSIKLSSPITITYNGDVTGSVTFDGSASPSPVALNLANQSGYTAGIFGSATSTPVVTVNQKGIVTGISLVSPTVASTSVAGIVQLNNTLTSTSTIQAATANAVKQAYDLATTVDTTTLKIADKGIANGVATLDATGRIPSSQLPVTGDMIASRLNTIRTIAITGDATYSVNFDGSANVTNTLTLSNSGVTAGSYGSSTNSAVITVDAKGRITTANSVPIVPTWNNIASKPTTVTGYGLTDVYTKTEIDALIQAAKLSSAPPGTIMFFAATTAPSGWSYADGGTLNRVSQSSLFSVIGTTFGAGDGTSTFNKPDMRGLFARGYDNGKGIDSGRVFGGVQQDDFKAHSHDILMGGDINTVVPAAYDRCVSSANSKVDAYAIRGTLQNTATGSYETRPKNMTLLPCIKL